MTNDAGHPRREVDRRLHLPLDGQEVPHRRPAGGGGDPDARGEGAPGAVVRGAAGGTAPAAAAAEAPPAGQTALFNTCEDAQSSAPAAAAAWCGRAAATRAATAARTPAARRWRRAPRSPATPSRDVQGRCIGPSGRAAPLLAPHGRSRTTTPRGWENDIGVGPARSRRARDGTVKPPEPRPVLGVLSVRRVGAEKMRTERFRRRREMHARVRPGARVRGSLRVFVRPDERERAH